MFYHLRLIVLAALMVIAWPWSAQAGDAPDDARMGLVFRAPNFGIDFTDAFGPNQPGGWGLEDVTKALFGGNVRIDVAGAYDPFIGFDLFVENDTDSPAEISLDLSASMQPQFAGTDLTAMADITLTDGTSVSNPDGDVGLTRIDSADPMLSAFVRSFNGITRSFGFFERALFEEDLLTPGLHEDMDLGQITIDAADVEIVPGFPGFDAPWNEMFFQLDVVLSPGDTLNLAARFDVVPEPAGWLTMLIIVAALASQRPVRRT